MTFRPWVSLFLTKFSFHILWFDPGRLEVALYPAKPPGRLPIPETSYNFIFYFPDLRWKEEGLAFIWQGEMEFFWSCKSGEVFGFWFHKNAFSWSMGTSHFLQRNFIWKYAQTYRRVVSTVWRILSPSELFEGLPFREWSGHFLQTGRFSDKTTVLLLLF